MLQPKAVSGELLARFAWDEDHFDDEGEPTWALFKPQRNKEREDKRRETSVSRIQGLNDPEIWDIGRRIKGASLVGRADLPSDSVIDQGLLLDCDPQPSNHAAIVNWVEGDTKLDQEERRSRGWFLARASTPHIVPDGA